MNSLYFTVIFILLCIFTLTSGLGASSTPKVALSLTSRLENGEEVDIFIKLSRSTSTSLQSLKLNQQRHLTRSQRLDIIHETLQKYTEESQKEIVTFLQTNSRALDFEQFWVTNQIYVKNADKPLLQQLMARFGNEIKEIYADQVAAHISVPVQAKTGSRITGRTVGEVQWGLEKMQVPEAWKELGYEPGNEQHNKNLKVPQLTVGSIDTGVRYTHETLRHNFVGEYGWFDPDIKNPAPEDVVGHGTHTIATVVGSGGIGVAPWAKWMACRACPRSLGCTIHDLVSCGQFFTCPTLVDGSSPDCSKAPDIVTNSWSAGAGQTWFDDVLEAWSVAGIISVFSIGNFGNAFCSSAFYPGDQPGVLGIGSSTIKDELSWFSSIGPTKFNGELIKPDVVAPGHDILSASNTGDSDYEVQSGTSMSCPHVSGLVLLLMTKNPDLSFEEIRAAVISGTYRNLPSRNLTCLGVKDTDYPNYVYGYGRVNALNSLGLVNSRK